MAAFAAVDPQRVLNVTVNNFLTGMLSLVRFDLGYHSPNNIFGNKTALQLGIQGADLLTTNTTTNTSLSGAARVIERYTTGPLTWYAHTNVVQTSYLCNVYQIKGPWAWVNSVFGVAYANFVSSSPEISADYRNLCGLSSWSDWEYSRNTILTRSELHVSPTAVCLVREPEDHRAGLKGREDPLDHEQWDPTARLGLQVDLQVVQMDQIKEDQVDQADLIREAREDQVLRVDLIRGDQVAPVDLIKGVRVVQEDLTNEVPVVPVDRPVIEDPQDLLDQLVPGRNHPCLRPMPLGSLLSTVSPIKASPKSKKTWATSTKSSVISKTSLMRSRTSSMILPSCCVSWTPWWIDEDVRSGIILMGMYIHIHITAVPVS
jgi:hypothetical protein